MSDVASAPSGPSRAAAGVRRGPTPPADPPRSPVPTTAGGPSAEAPTGPRPRRPAAGHAAGRPLPAGHPGRVGHRGRRRVLAGRGHRAAARRRGHRAAPARPRGRGGPDDGPDRGHPGRRDGGARAALGQLRAPRLRPAARRAGPEGARIPDDVLGAAVTEWVPGRSLAELVADGMISPLAAARAVAPLAAAAEAAHRHGLVLGLRPPAADPDHPGRARAAGLRAAPPDVTPADDVRGLGAILYTLLTSRWPLSRADAARAGLAAAERTPAGGSLPPSRAAARGAGRAGHAGPAAPSARRRARPRAHRGRGAQCCSTEVRGRGRPDRAVPARARRRAVRARRRVAGRRPAAAPARPASAGATWPSG